MGAMMKVPNRALLAVALASLAPASARADLTLKGFAADVVEQDVTYAAELCESTGNPVSTTWAVYYNLAAQPGDATPPDATAKGTAGTCAVISPNPRSIVWKGAAIGLYSSWARIDPNMTGPGVRTNDIAGPIEVCVGPDVVVKSFTVESTGAVVTYKAEICNEGSMAANKFRVGFWNDRGEAPPGAEMGDVFEAFATLAPATCKQIEVPAGLRPNGSFTAWSRADSGDFVQECREGNNPRGPVPYELSNPDLYIKRFDAAVAGKTVTYKVEVCNKGTAAVTKFFVDIYYHRIEKIPTHNDPGDEAKAVQGLAPEECAELTFVRGSTPDGDYFSYTQADADDFISEPDEGNNLGQMLQVRVGQGGTPPDGGPPPGADCDDNDQDGFGTGPGCTGIPDCDDGAEGIHPGVEEQCGDKIDQDCDLTPDDGCPGVLCTDADGDGFGVGQECVLADCDDANKDVFPWAAEQCGDNDDDNCNGIADDGCQGRQCVDRDADGFGVGAGCPGVEDCDDSRFAVHPKAQELCGNGTDDDCDAVADEGCGAAVDQDGDGASVGGRALAAPPPVGQGWTCRVESGAGGDEVVCVGDHATDPAAADPAGSWTCAADAAQPSRWTCRRPAGEPAATGQPDCDDHAKAVGPGAEELCGNGQDDDCDGTVDDGCEGVDCKDGDGDGWGVGAACKILDCKDDDPAVHPWAAEICGNGQDDDCDGTVDDGCPGVDCVDHDGDSWGVGKDCAAVDCDDSDAAVSAWAAELCGDGKDNDCDRGIDEGCPTCEDKDGDGHGVGPKCPSWDCDDDDKDVYPGAEERCDGKDNNCDGVAPTDEQDCQAAQEGCGCAAAPRPRALLLAVLLCLLALSLLARRRRAA